MMREAGKVNGDQRRPYQVVRTALEGILTSAAPDSLVRVSAGPIATHFGISRPPVERAISLLIKDGLLQPADGGKFVRQPLRKTKSPALTDMRDLLITIPAEVLEDAKGRATANRIYEEVQGVLAAVLPCSSFRLNESALATFYGVSRSVTNDVLMRLERRGFVSRGQSGRWIAPQITERGLLNVHEVRQYLEPEALLASAPRMDRTFFVEALKRVTYAESLGARLSVVELDKIEADLHGRCLAACENALLLSMIENLQAVQIAATHLPNASLDSEHRTDYLREHRVVYEGLIQGAYQLAAEALTLHLKLSMQRAIIWLDVARREALPPVPPYLATLEQ